MNTTQTTTAYDPDAMEAYCMARMAAQQVTYTTTATGSTTYPDYTTAQAAGLAQSDTPFTINERHNGRKVRGMAWTVVPAIVRQVAARNATAL